MNTQHRNTRFPDHPFWDFSISVYARDDVEPACLALQEQHGMDVNVLLFCCWTAATGLETMTEDRLRDLLATVSTWQADAVQPLRALRRRLKLGFEGVTDAHRQTLRQQIQTAEIDAEHIEQLTLAASVSAHTQAISSAADRAAVAVRNIRNYSAVLGLNWAEIRHQHLAAILTACFPEVADTVVRTILDGNANG